MYDDVNLSEFTRFLQKGNNTIIIEVSNAGDDNKFDFGVYTF